MTDIIIIGGGIAGISLAARLSDHAHVTVLETENALGYHASGRSAALYEPNYGAPSVNALSRMGERYFQDGGYLSDRGFLLVAQNGEDRAFEKDLNDLNTNEISVEDARQIVPILKPSITRAAYHSGAYDIDTDRLIQDFAKQTRSNGGEVITGAAVTRSEFADGLWTVHTSDRVLQAPTLVNAAGAWADDIAKLSGISPIGLTPYRRSFARVPAPGGHDVSKWPIFFGVGETWYAKPDAGKLLISPADEDAASAHDAFADDMVIAMGIDRYQQHVTEEVTRVETTWAGLRTFAPDRTLVLGRDAGNTSFVWCAGQGGYGFQTAPGASQFLADVMLGRVSDVDAELVAALSPHRF
ncbi:FAD-dependent oxidoreductase [Ascidiaceihabitans sp.]|uniref:NAD(P)/FAD-dependent oxidoreductase n=1 Tax=Ascidiaceihabitans sp. TaxID=1872644 RepID=UPI003296D44B